MKHSPEGGYINGPKNQTRREIYAFADSCLWNVPVPHRKVLVLESVDGREVEELDRRGYAMNNIHAVNRNPAVIATLNRRLDRRVVPHGVHLKDAITRLVGTLFHIIHLDFCEQFNTTLFLTVSRAVRLLVEGGIIAVTVQRGRETEPWFKASQEVWADFLKRYPQGPMHNGFNLTAGDCARIRGIGQALQTQTYVSEDSRTIFGKCEHHVDARRLRLYRSTGAKVSMLTVTAQIVPHRNVPVDDKARYIAHTDPLAPPCVLSAFGA